MSDNPFADLPPMSDEELDACAARIGDLSEMDADWVAQLLIECRRARAVSGPAVTTAPSPAEDTAISGSSDTLDANLTQVVLDAAEWLRTLWEVGYMGASTLPVPPRSHFPLIEVEDVSKSTLFTRIRHGKHPLPFPPPTRWGSPWHEIVESDEAQSVEAEVLEDEGRPAFAVIDGCNRWQILSTGADGSHVVQHAGKGPCYQLTLDPFLSSLQRLPPETRLRIVARERAGLRSYFLEWAADGRTEEVPLRAATRDGAEGAANAWIARHHPAHYGRVGFEHA